MPTVLTAIKGGKQFMLMVVKNLMIMCELHLTELNNQTCKLLIHADD